MFQKSPLIVREYCHRFYNELLIILLFSDVTNIFIGIIIFYFFKYTHREINVLTVTVYQIRILSIAFFYDRLKSCLQVYLTFRDQIYTFTIQSTYFKHQNIIYYILF